MLMSSRLFSRYSPGSPSSTLYTVGRSLNTKGRSRAKNSFLKPPSGGRGHESHADAAQLHGLDQLALAAELRVRVDLEADAAVGLLAQQTVELHQALVPVFDPVAAWPTLITSFCSAAGAAALPATAASLLSPSSRRANAASARPVARTRRRNGATRLIDMRVLSLMFSPARTRQQRRADARSTAHRCRSVIWHGATLGCPTKGVNM